VSSANFKLICREVQPLVDHERRKIILVGNTKLTGDLFVDNDQRMRRQSVVLCRFRLSIVFDHAGVLRYLYEIWRGPEILEQRVV
jgi:hypothetical protein